MPDVDNLNKVAGVDDRVAGIDDRVARVNEGVTSLDPLADRWPATDLASDMLRIAPCVAAHPSPPDYFQSTIMARDGMLVDTGAITIFFVEVYTRIKERRPGWAALSPVSQHALKSFWMATQPSNPGKVSAMFV